MNIRIIIYSFFLVIPFLKVFSSDTITDKIDERIQFYFNELQDNKKIPVQKAENDITIENNDIIYEIRINELDKTTPLDLQFNSEVKRFIEIYSIRRKSEFEKILGLADLYFPIIEEKLSKYNLPLELKYLAIVESSLNPLAVSKSGAVGLWQFLYNTSSMFDLEITSYIDERSDVYKSTEAACRYFTYLFNIFNNWELAIASFNGGPGEVRNAIEKSGGKTNFWDLVPYLSEQTKHYVPAFIACVYIMNYSSEHNMIKRPAKYTYFDIDTTYVQYELNLQQIAQNIDISIEELRFLNPVYKTDVIPVLKTPSPLVLPSDKIVKFIRKEDKIYNTQLPVKNYWTKQEETGDTINRVKLTHVVDKGEFLHKIAMNYQCSIEDIKKWNKTDNTNLYPGQQLIIWVPAKDAHLYIDNLDDKNTEGFIIYTVQEGDTIWSIAEKFNVKSITELKAYNNNLDENNIKPGQKIKINW